jgi:hypothetical protein
MTAVVTVSEPSVLSFDYEACGEQDDYDDSQVFDQCLFYIDDVEIFCYGRSYGWKTYSVALSPGTHTLRWSYVKDNDVDLQGDYFAVDNVAIRAAGLTGDVNGDGVVNITEVTTLIIASEVAHQHVAWLGCIDALMDREIVAGLALHRDGAAQHMALGIDGLDAGVHHTLPWYGIVVVSHIAGGQHRKLLTLFLGQFHDAAPFVRRGS